MWLLLACAPEERPAPSTPPTDDTAPVDTGEAPCALGDVVVTGALRPGETVTLSADGSVRWGVSGGALSATEGTTVEWTLPTDIAADVPEELEVTVSACGESDTLEYSVDWAETDRVVVLYNPSVDGSEQVARHYLDARGVPETHLCGVAAPDATSLDASALDAFLGAVQACIDAVGPHVWYLAPVYGVPYKVVGRIEDIGGSGLLTTTSLDALLFYGAAGSELTEAQYNPVYQDGDSATYTWTEAKTFGKARKRHDTPLYAVARLDGADADAAMALVDRALEGEALAAAGALDGIVYVDGRYGDVEPAADAAFGSYEWGEWNMWGTRHVFESLATYPVVWDGNEAEFGTEPAPLACPDALFYAGWYSYYNYNDAFTWAPGAVGGHLDSCSACDLRDATWSAEALQRGITATFGAVNEPYVAGMPEYDQLFLYLTQGATFGEAAYQSTVVGGWMMVFVGDPLYRPFPG
jgi:uncharacterized protein (TIGR03790 family)